MLKILILAFIIAGAAAEAKETLMVCNTSSTKSKRYYKLIDPWFGENRVEQKKNVQWKNWCREEDNCINFEVYSTGATLVTGEEVSSTEPYYREVQIWIDFEFLTRRVETRYYRDKTKAKRLNYKKDEWDGTYACQLR